MIRETFLIRETLSVGPLKSNCTILGDAETREAMVVDPGDEIPRVLAALTAHELVLRQIVVTHAHIDHIGGACELQQETGARIGYHAFDIPLLQMIGLQAAFLRVKTPCVALPDEELEHGSQVRVGNIVGSILHTPGHTRGSICVYLPSQSLLLTGDTLLAGSLGRTDMPGGSSLKLMRSVTNQLMSLPPATVVVPGHGQTTTIGWERTHNPALQCLSLPQVQTDPALSRFV